MNRPGFPKGHLPFALKNHQDNFDQALQLGDDQEGTGKELPGTENRRQQGIERSSPRPRAGILRALLVLPEVCIHMAPPQLNALENSVKARYGNDIDAAEYLQKFISLTFSLPDRVGEIDITRCLLFFLRQSTRHRRCKVPKQSWQHAHKAVTVAALFFLTGWGTRAHAGCMRIVTFNVQNLRLRRPAGRARFDGARDYDVPQDNTPDALALDLADRRLTSAVLAAADADVICLQEVFDLATLDFFHDHLLRHKGTRSYPYRICLPGNDGGGRDLAVLSRRPVKRVRSHAYVTPKMLGLTPPDGMRDDTPIFRRDCLRFRVGALTLFHCHFKAPWPDLHRSWPVRHLEALAVRKLVERDCAADAQALWLILGDLNEPSWPADAAPAIGPLLPPFSVDLLARMPAPERWTFYNAQDDHYACPDAMLASATLAGRWPHAIPQALRAGLDRAAHRATEARLADVGKHRPHASDHAALLLELTGL